MRNRKIKVIVCGSRTFNDYDFLEKTLCDLFQELADKGILYGTPSQDSGNIEIISGCAKGADALGERFAHEFDISLKQFPADWSIGGNAGFIRNEQMVHYVKECVAHDKCLGYCVAFWDGESKGTQHCFNYAADNLLEVTVKLYRGNIHE